MTANAVEIAIKSNNIQLITTFIKNTDCANLLFEYGYTPVILAAMNFKDISEVKICKLYDYFYDTKQELRQDILKDQEDTEFIKSSFSNSNMYDANKILSKSQDPEIENRRTRLDNIITLKNKAYKTYEYHSKLAKKYGNKEALKDFHTERADENGKIIDEVNPYIATRVVQLCTLIELVKNTPNLLIAKEILRYRFAEWEKHILSDMQMIDINSDLVKALTNTNLHEELLKVEHARNKLVTFKQCKRSKKPD
ncbi:MAG: hypothetical protein KA998_05325 [Rickettsiaceae bacterium]|nr:hypothetical protein [Rickettsiaceae bacterium]